VLGSLEQTRLATATAGKDALFSLLRRDNKDDRDWYYTVRAIDKVGNEQLSGNVQSKAKLDTTTPDVLPITWTPVAAPGVRITTGGVSEQIVGPFGDTSVASDATINVTHNFPRGRLSGITEVRSATFSTLSGVNDTINVDLLRLWDGNTLVFEDTSLHTVDEAGGLLAEIYDNSNLTGIKVRRIEIPNFNWVNGSPHGTVGADTFSIRWSGTVNPQFSQIYTFYTFTARCSSTSGSTRGPPSGRARSRSPPECRCRS
jgi:hypothetical protein